MLANVSYRDPELDWRISELVGPPFGLVERFRRGGVGSPRLQVVTSSAGIRALLALDNNMDAANLELRPLGVIFRFRSLLETYAWVIPYRQLSIFRSKGVYALHGPSHVVRIEARDAAVDRFLRRVIALKAEVSSQQPAFK